MNTQYTLVIATHMPNEILGKLSRYGFHFKIRTFPHGPAVIIVNGGECGYQVLANMVSMKIRLDAWVGILPIQGYGLRNQQDQTTPNSRLEQTNYLRKQLPPYYKVVFADQIRVTESMSDFFQKYDDIIRFCPKPARGLFASVFGRFFRTAA